MYVCMCVCIYIYIYIHIYTFKFSFSIVLVQILQKASTQMGLESKRLIGENAYDKGCVATVQGWTGSHGTQARRRKIAEQLGSPTYLYSRVGQSTHAASHCHTGRESQLPYILNAHKAGRVPRYCITELHSVHVGPFSRLWEYCLSGSVREPD